MLRIYRSLIRTYSHLIQNSSQFNSSAIDAGFHRAFWHSQHLLDFAVVQSFQVPKNYGFAQVWRKPAERFLQMLAQFGDRCHMVGPSAHRLFFFDLCHHIFHRIRQPISPRTAIMIYQKISRNAGNPGAKRSVDIAVASQRLVNAQENFLREVFRFLPLIREPVAEVKNASRMAAHQFLPRGSVSAQALLDQLGFWLQLSVSLASTAAPGFHSMERKWG
jgi:hypothetical protein